MKNKLWGYLNNPQLTSNPFPLPSRRCTATTWTGCPSCRRIRTRIRRKDLPTSTPAPRRTAQPSEPAAEPAARRQQFGLRDHLAPPSGQHRLLRHLPGERWQYAGQSVDNRTESNPASFVAPRIQAGADPVVLFLGLGGHIDLLAAIGRRSRGWRCRGRWFRCPGLGRGGQSVGHRAAHANAPEGNGLGFPGLTCGSLKTKGAQRAWQEARTWGAAVELHKIEKLSCKILTHVLKFWCTIEYFFKYPNHLYFIQ